MARVWNNVTNLELLKNRTILQLLKNQDDLLKEFASEIDRIEGVANTAVGTANNALSVATTARAESTAALQTAQAANAKSDEAKADAAAAETAAQNAANAAVAAQGSAAAAENSASQAASSAAAAAADAAKVNQLETKVNKNTSDISTINEDLATARLDIGAIEAREAGYGKSLSINGNSLSLMHDSNTLSTVTIPGGGGGSEIVARPLTGWKVQNQTTSLDITGAYYVPISDNIWYVCGKLLHPAPLSGNVGVRIIPPDGWGTPALVIGEVALGITTSYSRTLPIISQPSGTSADVIGVVPTPAVPGGLVKYDGESLNSFFFMAIRNAGV